MSKHDEFFMGLALDEARKGLTSGKIPVGAVFVLEDKVIARGSKTGKRHGLFDHAEDNACEDVLLPGEKSRLSGITVFVTMEPCLNCMTKLMTTRVKHIVYACEDPYGGGECLLKHPEILPPRFGEQRPTIQGGLCREQSRMLLKQYFLYTEEGKAWARNNPLVVLAFAA